MVVVCLKERIPDVEAFVQEWMDAAEIPGASLAIISDDETVHLDGFGARNLESNAPATPETIYPIGSITKSFTALAIMKLIEDGAVSLDDEVNQYVDHYKPASGSPIEIRELLSHTSGMPATPSGLFFQLYEGRPARIADEDDRQRMVQDSTSYRITDRSRFMYYNTGYNVLGVLIETVTGCPYDEFVRDEILEPLGMTRSTYSREEFDGLEDTCTPYLQRDGGIEAVEMKFEALTYPAGGLLSSVSELARYLRAMMNDGCVSHSKVCSAETVERLQRPVATRQTYLNGLEQQYGYGWMRESFLDDTLIGHAGSNLVSTAYIGFFDEAGIGVALTSNTYPDTHPGIVGPALLAILVGASHTSVPAFALREKNRTVSGTYKPFRSDFSLTVKPNGGHLSIEITPQRWWVRNNFSAYPESLNPSDYRYYTIEGDGAKQYLEFKIGGNVDELYYDRHRLRRQ